MMSSDRWANPGSWGRRDGQKDIVEGKVKEGKVIWESERKKRETKRDDEQLKGVKKRGGTLITSLAFIFSIN